GNNTCSNTSADSHINKVIMVLTSTYPFFGKCRCIRIILQFNWKGKCTLHPFLNWDVCPCWQIWRTYNLPTLTVKWTRCTNTDPFYSFFLYFRAFNNLFYLEVDDGNHVKRCYG